jgi:UPF0755 protein
VNRMVRVALILGICSLALAAGVLFFSHQFMTARFSNSEEILVFEVRPGDSFKTAAKNLAQEGMVRNARWLEIASRISGANRKVRVGQYELKRNQTPQEVLEILASGKSIEYSITIPEGWNLYEISELMEKQNISTRAEFQSLAHDKKFITENLGANLPSLEGYLFPDTYAYTKFTTLRQIVRSMVDKFKQNFATINVPPALQMTRAEIVTLASIIEKETGAPEERPVISSVFHNRLTKGMKLETDPTVIYGIWEKNGTWNRNISLNDLHTPNRYNTYTFTGLPYGPISNPGLAALKAAVAPNTSEFLFFVSRNDGTHIFSKDYAGHLKAVAKFQLDRRARENHSWRDLQKREKIPEHVVDSSSIKSAAKSGKPAPTPAN